MVTHVLSLSNISLRGAIVSPLLWAAFLFLCFHSISYSLSCLVTFLCVKQNHCRGSKANYIFINIQKTILIISRTIRRFK